MAPQDQGKPATDLLRRSLAASSAAEEVCPEPEILAAYSERSLDAEESARYELHFSRCARCREQLVAMVRSVAPEAVARQPRIRWIWTWGWIALAPVTAVLLIAAVFVARRPARRQAEEAPLMAMSRANEPPLAPAPSSVSRDSAETGPELKQSTPAKAAPSGASPVDSYAAPMQRPAPNFSAAMKSESEQPAAAPVTKDKVLGRSVSNLPTGARNAIEADKPLPPPAPPKPDRAAQPADAAELHATTQTVTVQSAASPATPPAPVPSRLSNADSAGAASAGNAVPPVAADAKKATALTAGATARSFEASQSVMPRSAVDQGARTLVQSPDPQVLWRISSGRYVERSSDAGATWRVQWTDANARVVAGAAPSADTCWLVGRGGLVLLTTDGKNWHAIEPPSAADFVAVAATDASSATVTTSDGRKFTTSDGSKHWTPAP